jgi:hypothetical protein
MNVALDQAHSMIQGALGVMNDIAPRLAGGDLTNLAENLVTLERQTHTVRAAATLVRVADETRGTLLDVLA